MCRVNLASENQKYFKIKVILTEFKHLIISKNTKIRKSTDDKFKWF